MGDDHANSDPGGINDAILAEGKLIRISKNNY